MAVVREPRQLELQAKAKREGAVLKDQCAQAGEGIIRTHAAWLNQPKGTERDATWNGLLGLLRGFSEWESLDAPLNELLKELAALGDISGVADARLAVAGFLQAVDAAIDALQAASLLAALKVAEATTEATALVSCGARPYYSFAECSTVLRAVGLQSFAQFAAHMRSRARDPRVPADPYRAYPGQFSAPAVLGYAPHPAHVAHGLHSSIDATQWALGSAEARELGVVGPASYAAALPALKAQHEELTWPSEPSKVYGGAGGWSDWEVWTHRKDEGAARQLASKAQWLTTYATRGGAGGENTRGQKTCGKADCPCKRKKKCLGLKRRAPDGRLEGGAQ